MNWGAIPAGGIVYDDVFHSVCSSIAISLEICVFDKCDGIFSDRKPSYKGHRLTVRSLLDSN